MDPTHVAAVPTNEEGGTGQSAMTLISDRDDSVDSIACTTTEQIKTDHEAVPKTDTDTEEMEPPLPPRVSRMLMPTFAALLAASTTIFLVVIIFHDILLTQDGTLPEFRKRVYLTCTTPMATAISWLISNQIKLLWLDEAEVFRRGTNDTVRRKRDAICSVSRLSTDSIRFFPITLTSVITGLMTTAIVAGIAPGDALRTFEDPLPCVSFLDVEYRDRFSGLTVADPAPSQRTGWYSWRDPKNSSAFYTVTPDNNRISTAGDTTWRTLVKVESSAQLLAPRYFPKHINFTDIAYAQADGILVAKNAMGVPRDVLSFLSGSSTAGGPTVSGELCAPVVSANPVKCDPTGSVTVHGNNLTVLARGCNITNSIYACDPAESTCDATVSGVCPGEKIGEVTIVMGSVGIHAKRLRLVTATGDDAGGKAATTKKWSVACTVSRPQFDFRLVKVNRIPDYSRADYSKKDVIAGLSYVAAADGACQPMGLVGGAQKLDRSLLWDNWNYANAAAASYPLLTQNRNDDGWWADLYAAMQSTFQSFDEFTTLLDPDDHEPLVVGTYGTVPNTEDDKWITWDQAKKFPDSRNKLEDALGVINSQAFTVVLTKQNPDNLTDFSLATNTNLYPAITRVAVQKVGSSQLVGLVYTTPMLYSLGCLLNLIRRRRNISLRGFHLLKRKRMQ